MNYYVDSTTMKQIDKDTIDEIGIPSMVLMERAALKVVSNIKHNEFNKKNTFINKEVRVLVLCGVGNNGGDGICAARILNEEGINTEVFVLGTFDKCSTETKAQFCIAKNTGVNVKSIEDIDNNLNIISFNEYDIIIDAIFGIGLTRNVEDIFYDVINMINNSSAKVYSVDIPSGVNADNGKVMNIAVRADYTITFGVNKKGLILHPGREYAGKVIVEDIGFSKCVVEKNCENTNVFKSFLSTTYKDYLPKRKTNSNKGDYGKVLIVAGSKNMAGACYFSAKSAYRMGAGLVQIYTCEENREILQELVPEAVMTTYNSSDNIDNILKQLDKCLDWCNVVVVGPGLGTDSVAKVLVKGVIYRKDISKVIDADAINLIANCGFNNFSNAILTPHMKEMSRLMDIDVSQLKLNSHNILDMYKNLLNKYFIGDNTTDFSTEEINTENNVLVLKDATTLITDGIETYVNTSGNNGLATGGSGDVLTGIIAGLLAQGKNNLEAGALGVYLHGLCAEYYIERANMYALNATDLIDSLQYIL